METIKEYRTNIEILNSMRTDKIANNRSGKRLAKVQIKDHYKMVERLLKNTIK